MKFTLSFAIFIGLIICIESSPQFIPPGHHPTGPSHPGGQRPCGRNEVYQACGSPCQPSCKTINQPCMVYNIRCPDGCYCRDGFVRSRPGGKCIPQSACRY